MAATNVRVARSYHPAPQLDPWKKQPREAVALLDARGSHGCVERKNVARHGAGPPMYAWASRAPEIGAADPATFAVLSIFFLSRLLVNAWQLQGPITFRPLLPTVTNLSLLRSTHNFG
jgi:hypothetical protein